MYHVFAGDYYYPNGGWGDHVGSTKNYDEALKLLNYLVGNDEDSWGHIINAGEVVHKTGRQPYWSSERGNYRIREAYTTKLGDDDE